VRCIPREEKSPRWPPASSAKQKGEHHHAADHGVQRGSTHVRQKTRTAIRSSCSSQRDKESAANREDEHERTTISKRKQRVSRCARSVAQGGTGACRQGEICGGKSRTLPPGGQLKEDDVFQWANDGTIPVLLASPWSMGLIDPGIRSVATRRRHAPGRARVYLGRRARNQRICPR
jgi:hypothetical protein